MDPGCQALRVTRLFSRFLVTVVVLVVLVVGADRAAAFLSARAVAQRIQHSQHLPSAPTIGFAGVPFLTQAVAGRYQKVQVGLSQVPSRNGLVLQRLDATLDGVHAPLAAVLNGTLTTLPVDHADATARVTFAELEASANSRLDGRVHVLLGRAGTDRVMVTASVPSPIGTFSVTGQVQLTASQGRVVVTLLPDTLSGIPDGLGAAVAQQIDVSALAPALPFDLSIRSVSVDSSGLLLAATGSNFVIK